MDNQDKKVLYMNDHPIFRVLMPMLVVGFGVFDYLLRYLFGPVSHIYRDTFSFDFYTLFPIIVIGVFYLALIVLSFISLEKSWWCFALIYGVYSVATVASSIIQLIRVPSVYDEMTRPVFYSIFGEQITVNLILATIFLLVLCRKRFSKYVLIIGMCLVFAMAVIDFASYIFVFDGVINDNHSVSCYIGDVLLDDKYTAGYFASSLFGYLPVEEIFLLIFAILIRVKKTQKPVAEPISNGAFSSYNQPTIQHNFEYNESAVYVNNTNTSSYINHTVNNDNVPYANTPVNVSANYNTPVQEAEIPSFCCQCGCKVNSQVVFCSKCGKKI